MTRESQVGAGLTGIEIGERAERPLRSVAISIMISMSAEMAIQGRGRDRVPGCGRDESRRTRFRLTFPGPWGTRRQARWLHSLLAL
jgi:hypothetical protein